MFGAIWNEIHIPKFKDKKYLKYENPNYIIFNINNKMLFNIKINEILKAIQNIYLKHLTIYINNWKISSFIFKENQN